MILYILRVIRKSYEVLPLRVLENGRELGRPTNLLLRRRLDRVVHDEHTEGPEWHSAERLRAEVSRIERCGDPANHRNSTLNDFTNIEQLVENVSKSFREARMLRVLDSALIVTEDDRGAINLDVQETEDVAQQLDVTSLLRKCRQFRLN